jgi:hypothetical protein
MTLSYARGRNINDNHPHHFEVSGFDEFIERLDADRAKTKAGAPYICGPLGGDGRRCTEGALPREWLPVDLDRIKAPALPAVLRWFSRFSGCNWATHSSTVKNPRQRILLELERAADRAECIAIGKSLKGELQDEFGDALEVDTCVFRPEQPIFLPPTGVEILRLTGGARPVDGAAINAIRPEQKRTEVDVSRPLSTSVSPLFSSVLPLSSSVPPSTIPQSQGDRNKYLFQFARHIKAEIPNASRDELRGACQRWHEAALPFIGTEDFAESFEDFTRGFANVKCPHGSVMNEILARADTVALSAGIAELLYGGVANRLVRICAALQDHAGAEPFFISARTAGEVLGVHYKAANKMLNTLVGDHVLELVTQGSGKKASRYRFVWRRN